MHREKTMPPAPEVVMDANGAYWRRYPNSLSMCPVSTDNEPLARPLAVYRLHGWEEDEERFTPEHEELRIANAMLREALATIADPDELHSARAQRIARGALVSWP